MFEVMLRKGNVQKYCYMYYIEKQRKFAKDNRKEKQIRANIPQVLSQAHKKTIEIRFNRNRVTAINQLKERRKYETGIWENRK